MIKISVREAQVLHVAAIAALRVYVETSPEHVNGLCSWLDRALKGDESLSEYLRELDIGYAMVGGASTCGAVHEFGFRLSGRSLPGDDGPTMIRRHLADTMLKRLRAGDCMTTLAWVRAYEE